MGFRFEGFQDSSEMGPEHFLLGLQRPFMSEGRQGLESPGWGVWGSGFIWFLV